MYAGLLFTHVISLSVWLGALVVLVVFIRSANQSGVLQQLGTVVFTGGIMRVMQGAALAVLLSGIGMLVSMGMIGNSKPLWLKLMEDGGGLIALLFVILITWMMRILSKTSDSERECKLKQLLNTFSKIAIAFILLISSIVFIVCLRFT
ncbi:hypothetical protein [Brevibacillus sp. SYSU BS000544]|uniref:hypothetical protein n=1 Tax=Brevibacillus sp. SYSU BS000544 TaxID=3416443 RepID=UPI003CE4567C